VGAGGHPQVTRALREFQCPRPQKGEGNRLSSRPRFKPVARASFTVSVLLLALRPRDLTRVLAQLAARHHRERRNE
jgi:hypothetical protein